MRELREELHLFRGEGQVVGLVGIGKRLEDGLVGHWLDGGASFYIGDEKGKCLIDTIAPCGYRRAVHASGGGGAVGGSKVGGASAHCLLGILPRIVEACGIGGYGESAGPDHAECGCPPRFHLMLAGSRPEPCQNHRHHHEEEIIGHLRVVAL